MEVLKAHRWYYSAGKPSPVHIPSFRTGEEGRWGLQDFQHIEDNKDQGLNVREKAKALVALLKDDERLKNERTRALMAKKRFAQNNVGISSDGSVSPPLPFPSLFLFFLHQLSPSPSRCIKCARPTSALVSSRS